MLVGLVVGNWWWMWIDRWGMTAVKVVVSSFVSLAFSGVTPEGCRAWRQFVAELRATWCVGTGPIALNL